MKKISLAAPAHLVVLIRFRWAAAKAKLAMVASRLPSSLSATAGGFPFSCWPRPRLPPGPTRPLVR